MKPALALLDMISLECLEKTLYLNYTPIKDTVQGSHTVSRGVTQESVVVLYLRGLSSNGLVCEHEKYCLGSVLINLTDLYEQALLFLNLIEACFHSMNEQTSQRISEINGLKSFIVQTPDLRAVA